MTRILAKIAVVACLLSVSPIEAKRIYSFRDQAGVVHFSDRPPDVEGVEVQEELVKVDPRKLVFLREGGDPRNKRYSLWNGYGGPVQVQINFESADNVISEPPLPTSVVIPGMRETLVLQVAPIDDYRGFSYRWSYRYMPGDPAARHDPGAVYRLPYDESTRLQIHQGFGGKFSHNLPHSQHAVDFAMDEGTPIMASRAGIVMAVESDFYDSGTDIAKFGDRANHIRILHPDGTMAVYAHLELESVLVSIGDRVRSGQTIARSGNTGFSTGPHLHFVVQRNTGGTLVSVPFEFTVDGRKYVPDSGVWLGGR